MIKVWFILLFVVMSPLTVLQAQTQKIDFFSIVSSLEEASSLSIAPSGHIYLTETNRHRLLVVSPDGVRSDSLGARGSGDYRFNEPVSVDATNGLKIYVADQNNGRIQLFDRRFQYLSTVSVDKIDGTNRFLPSQLQVSNSGDLYVYDSDRHVVYIFDTFGNFSREIDLRSFQIGSELHMKVIGSLLLILDQEAGVIHKFSADGGYMNFIGGFSGVSKIHGTPSDIWSLYADKVVKFSFQGESLRSYSFPNPVNPSDLFVHQNSLYVLSNNQLLKAQIE